MAPSLAPTACALLVTATLVTPAAAQVPTDKRVVGYYGSWSIYARDYHVAEIPGDRLSHINYAFVNISAGGECELGDPWADIQKVYPGDDPQSPYFGNFNQLQILKAQHPELRTLLSVGGWTWSGRFSDAALTPASRATFADSCVALMAQYGFDGIDIDWEFPVSGGLPSNTTRPEDRENLTLLLAELRDRLDAQEIIDAKPYLLTVAAPAVPALHANYELAAVSAIVDWINLMAYDFQGPWSPVTGLHAPLRSPGPGSPGAAEVLNAAAAIDAYLAAGVASDKIVLGAPLFGRGWSGVAAADDGLFQSYSSIPPGTYEAGVFDYRDLAINYVPFYRRRWHGAAAAPWLFDDFSATFISYDDKHALLAKADHVAGGDLGGMMMWELSMDDASHTLVHAVHAGGAANCEPVPRSGCDAAGSSSLSLKARQGKATLRWKLSRGSAARVQTDFGAPLSSTTHTLCLYDTGAAVAQAKMIFGDDWRVLGAKGFKYKSDAGVRKALLRGGAAGKPKLVVAGEDAGAMVPSLPAAEPVDLTVQLVNDSNDTCWSVTFSEARRNEAERFSARYSGGG